MPGPAKSFSSATRRPRFSATGKNCWCWWRPESAAFQPMDREKPVGVGPYRPGPESGRRRQLAETFDAVFVTVLGVDRFARGKANRLAVQVHHLPLETHQKHLDAPGVRIVGRIVGKIVEVEIRIQFAIGASQQ